MTAYERRLDEMLEQIFTRAQQRGMTTADLVAATGLCYATVSRAETYAVRLPRMRTILLLGHAVGMDLKLVGFRKKARRAS